MILSKVDKATCISIENKTYVQNDMIRKETIPNPPVIATTFQIPEINQVSNRGGDSLHI